MTFCVSSFIFGSFPVRVNQTSYSFSCSPGHVPYPGFASVVNITKRESLKTKRNFLFSPSFFPEGED